MTTTALTLTLRGATPADAGALDHLAALDSRPLPAGELLVAERDGRLAAAVSVGSLAAVADPFQRTDNAVELLRRQAVARRNARPARTRLRLVARAA